MKKPKKNKAQRLYRVVTYLDKKLFDTLTIAADEAKRDKSSFIRITLSEKLTPTT